MTSNCAETSKNKLRLKLKDKKNNQALWLTSVANDSKTLDSLRLALKPSILDVDELNELARALDNAAQHQQTVDASGTDPTVLRKLDGLHNAFKRVSLELDRMSLADEKLLDLYFVEYLGENALTSMRIKANGRSGFAHITEQMTESVYQIIKARASTGGRPANHRYSHSVAQLLKAFKVLFPDRKISYQPSSLLFRVVNFYLAVTLGDEDAKPATYIKHVKSTLES